MKQSSTVVVRDAARTIGLDVSDKWSTYVALDEEGRVVGEGRVITKKSHLAREFGELPKCRIALEAGTHSAWISRTLYELPSGHPLVRCSSAAY